VVKGSEEAREEEDFGGNEENHTIPQTFLNRRCMVALECSFSDDISSSLIHGQGCKEKSEGY
jgi:hypothetical protein